MEEKGREVGGGYADGILSPSNWHQAWHTAGSEDVC